MSIKVLGKTLTLEEKYLAIQMVAREKRPVKEVMEHFKCGKTQMYNVLKNKDTIISHYMSVNNEARKSETRKTRGDKYDKINSCLFKWFCAAKAKNFLINGPLLKEKAKEFAVLLKTTDFKASNGWLEKFAKRNHISFRSSCEETNHDAEQQTVLKWFDEIRDHICSYDPKNVAFVDESALFFRTLPDKSLYLKGDKCSKGAQSKERFTIVLTVFADGAIEKPMLIGKTNKPRCFKNLNKAELPVEWKANENAWLTGALFSEHLSCLNKKMKSENRHILLFMDNAISHQKSDLSNITVVFFPPKITPALQPLDCGIIQSVKLNYRRLMLSHLLSRANSNRNLSELSGKINALDAILFFKEAIRSVKAARVANAFRRCGFIFEGDDELLEDLPAEDYSEVQRLMDALYPDNTTLPIAEEYSNFDNDMCTEINIIDLNCLVHQVEIQEVTIPSDEEMESDEDCEKVPTASEMTTNLQQCKNYAKHIGSAVLLEKVFELETLFNTIPKPQKKAKLSALDFSLTKK